MRTHTANERRWRGQRGQALIETALTLPLLLLVGIGIIEFGRAYQTWQVLTNAAREGARMSSLPNTSVTAVQDRVKDYLLAGALPSTNVGNTTVNVDQRSTVTLSDGTTVTASQVVVDYPFQFMVLGPIAQMVVSGSTVGSDITMRSTAQMRNEAAF
jgi:Flp pilus assembly protein TadG